MGHIFKKVIVQETGQEILLPLDPNVLTGGPQAMLKKREDYLINDKYLLVSILPNDQWAVKEYMPTQCTN